MNELEKFIASNPDPRELKRGLAVKMRLQGYRYQDIQDLLQVSSGFVRDWFVAFEQQGVDGLRLGYQGSQPYLDARQRLEVRSVAAPEEILALKRATAAALLTITKWYLSRSKVTMSCFMQPESVGRKAKPVILA